MMSSYKPSQSFSFGVVADVQYADLEPNLKLDRYFENSLTKLNRAIDTFNQHKVDFVIDLGDLIDRHWHNFAPAAQCYSRLQMPRYQLAGNHDFMIDAEQKSQVAKALSMPALHYTFTHHNTTFVVLNGNDISLAAHNLGHKSFAKAKAYLARIERYGQENARPWNSALSHQQLNWMDEQIAQAAAQGRAVVVACHMPVYPLHRSHNLWNDEEVLDRLTKHNNILAYLNGHDHRGHYALLNNTHFINFSGMVQTQHQGAYAIVTMQEGHLHVQGVERQQTMHLELTR